jgi:hypothetical protein
MVVYKAKKSDTGAQFYQSDAQKRAVLAANGKETKSEAALAKALFKKVNSGKTSPEDAGSLLANVFIDSISDAIDNPPKSKGTGKAVMKGRGGKFKGVN